MKRTLMQLGIGALEEMFAASKADAKVLRQLENELQHRQVPRAVVLLDQVQLAMKRAASALLRGARNELPLEPSAAPAVPVQPPPPIERTVPTVVVAAAVPQPAAPSAPRQANPAGQKLIPVPRVRIEQAPIPIMSLDDACKLLKVTLASPWQEVELSRRKLVLLSHPRHVVGMTPERQEGVRAEARRVNVAYAVLSAARTR